jgi:hypothetical protein
MFFLQMGGAVLGKESLTLEEFATAFETGLGGVLRIGKAEPGDKTMVDALIPARDALRAAIVDGASVGDAVARMARGAEEGCSPRCRSSPAGARELPAAGRAPGSRRDVLASSCGRRRGLGRALARHRSTVYRETHMTKAWGPSTRGPRAPAS